MPGTSGGQDHAPDPSSGQLSQVDTVRHWPAGTQLLQYRWYDPALGIEHEHGPVIRVRAYITPDTEPALMAYELEKALRSLVTHLLQTERQTDANQEDQQA